MIRERTSAGLAAARAEGRVGGRRKKLDAAKRREIALQEVRALLDEAIAASEEGPAATLLPDTCTGLGRLPGVPGELGPASRDHPRISGAPAWSCRRH